MKTILKGTIIGGIIAFVWGTISWMVIPWHQAMFQQFKNPANVESAILRNVEGPGVYTIPGICDRMKEEKSEIDTGKSKAVDNQLVMMAMVVPNMGNPMKPSMFVIGFIINMISAFFLTWVTKCAQISGYLNRLLFILGVVVVAACMTVLPTWNYWHSSAIFTIISFADLVLTWVLAGLGIAAVTKKPTQQIGL